MRNLLLEIRARIQSWESINGKRLSQKSASLKILAGGRGTCHTFLTRPGPTWPQQITSHLFNVAKMWKPRKRAHKLFVFDDSRTDYRTKCFCTQKINLVKCGGNGSSHTKNHISLIALQCSIQIVNTETFHYFMCSNTHTLQMHFHARHWLQKLHIWAQLDAWRITERGIWVVLASSTRSSRLGPPSQTITKIGPNPVFRSL